MFPTEIAGVLLILGLMFISFLSDKALMYVLTGLVIIFIDLQDTTNGAESLLMFLIGFLMLYYGATKKK